MGGRPKIDEHFGWGKTRTSSRGPKKAKIQYGVKPDIFKITHLALSLPINEGNAVSTETTSHFPCKHNQASPASIAIRFRRARCFWCLTTSRRTPLVVAVCEAWLPLPWSKGTPTSCPLPPWKRVHPPQLGPFVCRTGPPRQESRSRTKTFVRTLPRLMHF